MDDEDLLSLIDFFWSEISLDKEDQVWATAKALHPVALARYEQWVEAPPSSSAGDGPHTESSCAMGEPIKLLIELAVDPDKFDLSQYIDEAEGAGWAREAENGVWYLAEEIISEHVTRGCNLTICV